MAPHILKCRTDKFTVQWLNLKYVMNAAALVPYEKFKPEMYKIVLNKGALRYCGSFLILFA